MIESTEDIKEGIVDLSRLTGLIMMMGLQITKKTF